MDLGQGPGARTEELCQDLLSKIQTFTTTGVLDALVRTGGACTSGADSTTILQVNDQRHTNTIVNT